MAIAPIRTFGEGCRSFPRAALPDDARGFDRHGEPVVIRGGDLRARALPHRTDHLDGCVGHPDPSLGQRELALTGVYDAAWGGQPVSEIRVSAHPTAGTAG